MRQRRGAGDVGAIAGAALAFGLMGVTREIYQAGRKSPIECSSVLYEAVEAANRAGKAAGKQLLTEFPD
jgi:hypothetical protein